MANDDYTGIKSADELLSNIEIQPSTLENIDTAMYKFVDESLDVFATQNDGFKKVPVLFASAERAFLVKEKRAVDIRDEDGTLRFPLISIERTDLQKSAAGMKEGTFIGPSPLFVDPIHGSYIQINKKIVRDKTNNFTIANNIKNINGVFRTPSGSADGGPQPYFPVKGDNKEVVLVSYYLPRPTVINMKYVVTLKSNYIQQINEMVEPFVTVGGYSKGFVISNNGHRYESFMDGTFAQKNNVSSFADSERIYTTVINFSVVGYLMGEGNNQIRPKVIKRENAVRVKIPRERVIFGDMQDFDPSSGFYQD